MANKFLRNQLCNLRVLFLKPQLRKKLNGFTLMMIILVISLAVRYLSNSILPHSGSDPFLLTIRSIVELGIFLGFVLGVLLLVEDYRTNNGKEYFGSTIEISLNLIRIPLSAVFLFLIGPSLIFIFSWVPITEFFIPLFYGPHWEFENIDFYLIGVAMHLLVFFVAHFWE